jgi:spore maturation protein CgeB
MKRILLLGLHYPFAILSYFRHALEKRPDVELVTAGVYTGDYIPWNGGMRLPQKYVKRVDLPLPASFIKPSWKTITDRLGNNFDLVLNVDAGSHLADKPDVPYAVVATDPHVLGEWYKDVRPRTDFFFNMQRAYFQEGDIHLPYACSPDHHYAISNVVKVYDASLIGLHYPQRDGLVQALRGRDYKVLYELGIVYDEYREQNNSAYVGLNWSSLQDINARFFEAMAMKQVLVANRLPHIEELGLEEDRHYLGFDTVEEAVEKVAWARANQFKFADAIANNGYQLVHERHTYENRIQQIFNDTGI